MPKPNDISLLRGCMIALRGARNPHVFSYTLRLLRSVRLILHPLATATVAMLCPLQHLKSSLASVWLLTAIVSFLYPLNASLELLARVGLTGEIALAALYSGIAVDALMGLLTLMNGSWQKWLWLLQACIILTYTLIIAIYLPELALHPFGMLIKNIPILAILWVLWKETKKAEAHHV